MCQSISYVRYPVIIGSIHDHSRKKRELNIRGKLDYGYP